MNDQVPSLTDGEQLSDFMYVADVAKAICVACEKGKSFANYYVGGTRPIPLKDLVLRIHKLCDCKLPTGLGRKDFNGKMINYNSIPSKNFYKDTGFKPTVELNEGLEKTILWHKSMKGEKI